MFQTHDPLKMTAVTENIYFCKTSFINLKPSRSPEDCLPWHYVSYPPRQCGVGGEGHWSALPGWRRCRVWSSAAEQRMPSRDQQSSRWKRRPPLALWHWPETYTCQSTDCQSVLPPASRCQYLQNERKGQFYVYLL